MIVYFFWFMMYENWYFLTWVVTYLCTNFERDVILYESHYFSIFEFLTVVLFEEYKETYMDKEVCFNLFLKIMAEIRYVFQSKIKSSFLSENADDQKNSHPGGRKIFFFFWNFPRHTKNPSMIFTKVQYETEVESIFCLPYL